MCKQSQLATCLLAGTFLLAWAPSAPAATSTVRVTSGLSRPVFLTAPASDTGRAVCYGAAYGPNSDSESYDRQHDRYVLANRRAFDRGFPK